MTTAETHRYVRASHPLRDLSSTTCRPTTTSRAGPGLHDALHVRGPAVLARDEDARRVGEARRDDDLVDLVVEDLLHELAEALGGGLGLLELLLLLLGLLHLEALLGRR